MVLHIKPEEIWSYFEKHRLTTLVKEMTHIASDEGEKADIYLTEERGNPWFVVDINDETVYQISAVDDRDTTETYKKLLMTFFPGYSDCPENKVEEDDPAWVYGLPDEDDTSEAYDSEDIDRLNDIDAAVEDMLNVFLENSPDKAGLTSVEREEIADIIAQTLFDRYGVSVYLPTLIIDADGLVNIEKYPYKEDIDD